MLIVSGRTPAREDLERLRPGRDGFYAKPLRGPELVGRIVELLA